jgi:hypothetical protein
MTDRAPKRSYISMRAYNGDIFSYSTRVVNDFETVGELGAVAGANAGNCPQGRILTESGRKLYPGANPGITQLMVSVFDYATGLSGFIDPNSAAFTPQNTDRPYYFTSPGANTAEPNPDRAPPVFTRGDVLAQGNFDLSGSAHIYGDTLIGGDMDLSGSAHIYGDALIGGDMDLSGSAHIYGAVEIEGVTTMNNNVIIGSGGTSIERVTTGTITVGADIGSNQKAEIVVAISGMQAGDMVVLQHPVIDRSLLYVGHNTENGQIRIYVYNNWGTNIDFSNTWSYLWFKM